MSVLLHTYVYTYVIHVCTCCVGEGLRAVAVLHVLPSVPPSGAAEQEGRLGQETAGTLPQ